MKNPGLIFTFLIIISVFIVFASSTPPNNENKKIETLENLINIQDSIQQKNDSITIILENYHMIISDQLKTIDSLIELKKK